MAKRYIRLTKGLYDKGILIKPEEVQNHINSEKDFYTSLYYYNEEQLKRFKENGTVKGIRDTKTDLLWFDFDHETNPELARKDAQELINRLIKAGIKEENFEIYFSGNKGFNVIVNLNRVLTPEQVHSLAVNKYGKDLETLDKSMYDSVQLLRVPYTKHQKSGLYKIPLTKEQLLTLSLDDIKALAKSLESAPEAPEISVANPPEDFFKVANNVESKTTSSKSEHYKLDLTQKPPIWKNCKWSILQGNFKIGERHSALMVLAATLKGMGYDEFTTRHMCLAADEKHCKLTKDKPVTDLESNIIPSIYNEYWEGGQYSCEKEGWLQGYCKALGENACKHEVEERKPVTISQIATGFKDYVKNIDKNTIKTGIKQLDKTMPITIGLNLGIVAAAGAGKCLGKDTPVRMYNGSVKLVQNILPNDLLMGDDSKPRKVLSICTGKENLYKIKQESGMEYIVNESHILSLKCNYTKINKTLNGKVYTHKQLRKGNIIDISILDYQKQNKQFKKYFKGYHVEVEYPEQKVSLDPYFLGLWLGDGVSSKINITNPDKEVINYLDKKSKELNYKLKNHDTKKDKCPSWSLTNSKNKKNCIMESLREFNLLENKHIPKKYLINNRYNRLKLLAGLLDSDGYYDSRKNAYELTTKYANLAEEIRLLVRSLGFRATIQKEIKGCNYKGELKEGIYYRLYITGNNIGEIPVLIERKKAINKERRLDTTLTNIEIIPLGKGDYYGFEIDGNHRFLLEDYTVTHNTSIALEILKNTSKSGVISVMASLDMHRNRLYEKLLYKVSGGKTREEIYEMFDQDKEKEIMEQVEKDYGNVWFYDRSSPTVADIRQYVIQVERETGKKVKLVMIDYFERVTSDVSDDTAASKRIAGELQDLINDLDVAIVTLVQPNKFSISAGPDEPILSYTAIKGSSFLYQSFRSIVSMWRPFYLPTMKDHDKFLEMAILKNDLGEIDHFIFGWTGKTGDIRELNSWELEEYERLMEMKKNEKKKKDDDSGSGGWS